MVLPLSLLCQDGGDGEYQMLLDEIALFRDYSDKEVNISLLDSASFYAKQGQQALAVVFLEELLDQYSETALSESPAKQQSLPTFLTRLSFSVRAGIDYNNQEFETKTENTDDNELFVDQVNKPYAGLLTTYLIWGDYRSGLTFNSLIRYDKENFNGYVNFEQKFLGMNANGLININYFFDANKPFPDLTYREISSRQVFEWSAGNSWRMRLNNILRYKIYQRPVESTPNFIRNTFDGYIVWQNSDYKTITLDMTNDYNESIDYENNDYYEQLYNISLNQWLGTTFNNSLSFGLRLNRFNYVLLDSLIHNFSRELRLTPSTGFYLSPVVKMDMTYNYIYKTYREKTEQEPDYHYHYFDLNFSYMMQNYRFTSGYRF